MQELVPVILEYWYVAIPEMIYLAFLGMSLIGPAGVLLVPVYLALLMFFPEAAIIAVGAVVLRHIIVIVFKSFAGDAIAKSKKQSGEEEYRGIPKLSGDSKDVQDVLDKLKGR